LINPVLENEFKVHLFRMMKEIAFDGQFDKYVKNLDDKRAGCTLRKDYVLTLKKLVKNSHTFCDFLLKVIAVNVIKHIANFQHPETSSNNFSSFLNKTHLGFRNSDIIEKRLEKLFPMNEMPPFDIISLESNYLSFCFLSNILFDFHNNFFIFTSTLSDIRKENFLEVTNFIRDEITNQFSNSFGEAVRSRLQAPSPRDNF
jgi:hypothetical protein